MASLKATAKEIRPKKKSSSQKKEPKKSPQTYKSNEFIQESDDEQDKNSEQDSDSSEEEATTNISRSSTNANGKPAAPVESSSESESDSNGEEASTGDDGEDDEDKDEDEDEEEEESGSESPVATILKPAKKPAKESTSRTVSFKTSTYKPPTGFEQGKLDGASRASELFKKSNLEGKQIWYFTAPASVPVSVIENMSLLDVKNGSSVLQHKGEDYGFVQDSAEDKTYTKIMVPSSSDDGYRAASKPIEHILHLQHIISLPGVHEGVPSNKESASKATIPAKRPARPQPRGLKMRFRPLGFGNGEVGTIGSESESNSDEEMEDAPAPIPSEPERKSKPKSERHKSGTTLKRKHIEGEEKKKKNKKADRTTARHGGEVVSVN